MKTKRIMMSLVGVIITAISVGAFKFAAFGVDPFQSFMSGIDFLIPVEFGTLYVLVNALLLLFSLIADRIILALLLLSTSFCWVMWLTSLRQSSHRPSLPLIF